MRPISKVFFFGLVVFLLSFLPLDSLRSLQVLAGHPNSESDLKAPRGAEMDLIRWFDPAVGGTHHFQERGFEPNLNHRDRSPFMVQAAPFPLKTRSSITPPKQGAMEVLIDDFLVNDDTTGGCDHWYPTIARAPSGNFVITWQDYRNGNWGDIYAQRYNSTGTPLGSSFKVNDAGTARRWYPAIAMDGFGNFVITWTDERNGNYDIYAQRYDLSGNPLGSNFKVNDDTESLSQWYPFIALDGSGNFVITWSDYRNGNSDIYAQRYHSSGALFDTNFKVNDDTGTANQWYSAIAMDDYGNFVITWEDHRNGNSDNYAQRYHSSGALLDTNFKVNDDTGTADQRHSAIAMDDSGNFVIAWEDDRSGNWCIYAQRYDSAGTPTDSNFKVNDNNGYTDGYSPPAIAMDGSGNFVITWEDDRYDYLGDIYAQRYDSYGTPLDSNFKVNDDAGPAMQYSPPAIAMDGSGNFVVTWEDHRNDNWDIYAQRYDAIGSLLDFNFKVNDDAGTADQWYPDIAIDGSSNFVITWEDARNGNWGDIYAQRYTSSGIPLGSNFKVNDDTGTPPPYPWCPPAIAMDGSGNFVITWEDPRNGNSDIYAQRYTPTGTPLDSNFKVNDGAGTSGEDDPAIAMDGSGNFVITWTDRRYGRDIYAQRYASTGIPLDSNFKVNDDDGTARQWFPAIAIDGFSNFVITWEDERNGDWDIYAQRYDSSGTLLGSNFQVNDDTGSADWWSHPAIAMDDSGDFVITWGDKRNGNWDIYAQRYESSGTPLGFNFKVNDDAGSSYQDFPAVGMKGSGNFVITWTDYRNGVYPDIYAQRYNSSGDPVGTNYLVPNPEDASFAQQYPAVAANGSNIYFTWMDNRRAKGWDIYAKVVGWDWTKVEEDLEVNLPYSFELSQNYPNPFNPVTRIQYTVGSRQIPIHTTLRVYNIRGQLVRTLVDEENPRGNYDISWDGKNASGKEVASGIYFYQLKTEGFAVTKKMILLR